MRLITLEKKRRDGHTLHEEEAQVINTLIAKAGEYSAFHIEIGCGNGHFLTSYAAANREHFILGVELKTGRSSKTARKLERFELSNGAILCGKGEDLINNLPPESVDAYHIYFPDPWPKAKHKKRRFLRMGNLNRIRETLKPGGRLYFASDIFDYTFQTRLLILLHEGMTSLDIDPLAGTYSSLFANRFRELEKKFFFAAGERLG